MSDAGTTVTSALIERSLERHLDWARDYALAGDVDSSLDAIDDARALWGELRLRERTSG
jgi:hypothetical protein